MKNQRGLTLFELLIVLTIIGLFALVATPSIIKSIKVARIKATELELENLDTALGLYSAANNNTFPQSLDLLVKGGYIRSFDNLKDKFGMPYQYSPSQDKESYILFSDGPDKVKGTTDDMYSKNSLKPGE